jgi:amino acid transporter
VRILLISDIIYLLKIIYVIGSFDSAVHISEEASNAATAVPWGIIWSVCIAAIFGLGITLSFYHAQLVTESKISNVAVNVTLAFCMGQDLESLMNSSLGQPMAQIFLNSLGQKGTLVMWSFIILAQYMMGSSMVYFFYSSRSSV